MYVGGCKMGPLQGKTAIITGSRGGIGARIAKELAKEGTNVVLAARNVEKLSEIEKEIKEQKNGKVLTVQTDVKNKQHDEELVNKDEEATNNIATKVHHEK